MDSREAELWMVASNAELYSISQHESCETVETIFYSKKLFLFLSSFDAKSKKPKQLLNQ